MDLARFATAVPVSSGVGCKALFIDRVLCTTFMRRRHAWQCKSLESRLPVSLRDFEPRRRLRLLHGSLMLLAVANRLFRVIDR
ncbi:MAG: hypothetical protein EBW73_02100 [Betaproteobacteria bacterium]|nr:hypothetical protein [Betaproteobacteria bacterium]